MAPGQGLRSPKGSSPEICGRGCWLGPSLGCQLEHYTRPLGAAGASSQRGCPKAQSPSRRPFPKGRTHLLGWMDGGCACVCVGEGSQGQDEVLP